jgi:hypothetical protein
MKHLASLLLATVCLTLLALPIAAKASRPEYSVCYDATAKQWLTGAQLPLVAVEHDVLGVKGLDVDVLGLVASTDQGVPTIGGVLAGKFPFSREHYVELGLGGRVESGQYPHCFLYAGIGARF